MVVCTQFCIPTVLAKQTSKSIPNRHPNSVLEVWNILIYPKQTSKLLVSLEHPHLVRYQKKKHRVQKKSSTLTELAGNTACREEECSSSGRARRREGREETRSGGVLGFRYYPPRVSPKGGGGGGGGGDCVCVCVCLCAVTGCFIHSGGGGG